MPLKTSFAYNLERVKKAGAETIQIFPGNPTSWKPPSTSPGETGKRTYLLEQMNIYPLIIHAAYLVNLASANNDFYDKSVKLLHETLHHAVLYRTPFVIVHTGSHGGEGVLAGTGKIIRALENELSDWPGEVKLLLENTAGGGNQLGSNMKEIGQILKYFPGGPFGFCFDTAHAWAAGYDLSGENGVKRILEEIEREIGLQNLHVIHANDTEEKMGSGKDRHAHIGEGRIGFKGFKAFFSSSWPKDLPVILETPGMGTEKEKENLSALRSCIRN